MGATHAPRLLNSLRPASPIAPQTTPSSCPGLHPAPPRHHREGPAPRFSTQAESWLLSLSPASPLPPPPWTLSWSPGPPPVFVFFVSMFNLWFP